MARSLPLPDALESGMVGGDAIGGAGAVPVAAAPASAEAARHGWRVLGILSVLMGFASISTDLYLPAMPAMEQALHAGVGAVEWTISGYLIGFSIGQLFWGPIGDRFGRRLPVAIGIALFVVGSAGIALATSVWAVIGWRIVQAIGASAGVVLGRAMVRDLYAGDRAAQMMSTLMTVMAIAPLIGPSIGGQILILGDWRMIFWVLVGVGLATLAALLTLPETLPPARRSDAPLGQALARYGDLLRHRRLLGYAGAGGFFYMGTYAYIAGSPFAYISYHHVPPAAYGLLFASAIAGIMAANMINARLVMRLGGDRMLRRGAVLAAAAAIVLAIAAATDLGGLWGLVLPLLAFSAAAGFIVANAIAGAMADFPESAGAVSALIGASQYGSGIVGSALVGLFADGTPRPMALIIMAAGIGSLLSTRLIAKDRRRSFTIAL